MINGENGTGAWEYETEVNRLSWLPVFRVLIMSISATHTSPAVRELQVKKERHREREWEER